MSLTLEELTNTADFIAPRDEPVTAFTWWERGGTALDDVSEGVDVRSWYFSCDPATGIVTAEVPGVITPVTVYTISPLPVEITGSFDLDMHPVLAWRDVNDDAFLRWEDANIVLPARTQSLRLALDDVRDAQFDSGVTDLILAYTRDGTLFCRQLSEDFAIETTLADGFPKLYQIGMNVDFRFQFQRAAEGIEAEDVNLSYFRSDNRADKFVGFDPDGNAVLYDVVVTGEVGDEGPAISSTKTMGHTFFLRRGDGTWGTTTCAVTVSLYRSVERRAHVALTFTADVYGNITRVVTGAAGEAVVRIAEAGVGTPTYSATVYVPETGQGVSFNVVSFSGTPTTDVFTPSWNASSDYPGGGLVPTGTIRYKNFDQYTVLLLESGTFTARSASTRLRWGPGSLPEHIRPAAPRSVPCYVSRNGVELQGRALIAVNGSVEFWPTTDTNTDGSFLATGSPIPTKGLPDGWVLVYAR